MVICGSKTLWVPDDRRRSQESWTKYYQSHYIFFFYKSRKGKGFVNRKWFCPAVEPKTQLNLKTHNNNTDSQYQ